MAEMYQRWELRLINYSNALSALKIALKNFNKLNKLEKDGLIQRFEITFDLAWKLMQDYLIIVGYADIKGPRPVITQMGNDQIIDPFLWQELLTARNELSHIYDFEKSRNYISKIESHFFPAFKDFETIMKSKNA